MILQSEDDAHNARLLVMMALSETRRSVGYENKLRVGTRNVHSKTKNKNLICTDAPPVSPG